jgi:hypothetical protein
MLVARLAQKREQTALAPRGRIVGHQRCSPGDGGQSASKPTATSAKQGVFAECATRPFRCAIPIVAAVVILVGFASGCENDTHNFPNDRRWESTHFRYHTRKGDDGACEAVLSQLERHFELMQAYLGFPWPEGRKVDYYKFLDEDDYLSNAECPQYSGACTVESSIRSYAALQEHELIHAYLAPLGLPPRFFVEAIAMVIACDDPFSWLGDTGDNFDPWQSLVTLPASEYQKISVYGPWFVGYLLNQYGPEQFITLYDRLNDESASAEQIASTFKAVYGETIDAVWNAAIASSVHSFRCVNIWRCNGGSAMLLDGSPQSLGQACDGSDNTRTFELNTDTDVVLSQYDLSYFFPASCDRDNSLSSTSYFDGDASHPVIARIGPGKYFVLAQGLYSGTIGIRALATSAFSQDCGQNEAIDMNTREFKRIDLDLTLHGDGKSSYVKLHIADGRRFWSPRAVTPEIEECLSCEGAPDCHPLDGYAQPDADRNVTLRLTPPASDAQYKSYLFGHH